jgi:hypothetical protein
MLLYHFFTFHILFGFISTGFFTGSWFNIHVLVGDGWQSFIALRILLASCGVMLFCFVVALVAFVVADQTRCQWA